MSTEEPLLPTKKQQSEASLDQWQQENADSAAGLLEQIEKHLKRCSLFEAKRRLFEQSHTTDELAEWDKAVMDMLLHNAIEDQLIEREEKIPLQLYVREYLSIALHDALTHMYEEEVRHNE